MISEISPESIQTGLSICPNPYKTTNFQIKTPLQEMTVLWVSAFSIIMKALQAFTRIMKTLQAFTSSCEGPLLFASH